MSRRKKNPENSFQTPFLVELFDKNFNFAVSHKLVEFNYRTAFHFQVSQENVLLISCLCTDDVMKFKVKL